MDNNRLATQLLTVGELFDERDATYIVPIYQRNYAWQAEQIEQLLRDIRDAHHDGEAGYFLGNLMVTDLQGIPARFEVIDGQQRLTTIYLLLTFLAQSDRAGKGHQDILRYESRPRATAALRRIAAESAGHRVSASRPSDAEDAGINEGYDIIRQFMAQHIKGVAERDQFAQFLRTKVTVVRASLPLKTDFNRYFEIMNTRGQQLRQTDIVKARLMQHLEGDAQQACFAWIWEACADMDSYVQMSLTRGDTGLRTTIFGEDWSLLASANFDDLAAIHTPETAQHAPGPGSGTSLTLDAALEKYAVVGLAKDGEDPDNVRFRSIIEFPAFLLHVLQVVNHDSDEAEGRLDDKSLIKHFDQALKYQGAAKTRWVAEFAFSLLRCRNLFDSFVLKRDYSAINSDDGAWSLQRLIKRSARERPTPSYTSTFSRRRDDGEEDADTDPATKDLLMLQSMLRVTYTSPRTMHWMTLLLKQLYECPPAKLTELGLADVLRKYARGKVRDAFFMEEEPRGFNIHRIVFTYLDYLIWTRLPNREFRFSFRNSIEHFYPQHPDEMQSGAKVSDEWLHSLGNLALVSVGANSKFSNSLPNAKAINFQYTIEEQSLKLHAMAQSTRVKQAWGDTELKEHHHAMVELLRSDLGLR